MASHRRVYVDDDYTLPEEDAGRVVDPEAPPPGYNPSWSQ